MFASLFVKLANIGLGMDLMVWKLSPKLHLLTHLIEDQMTSFGNCRFWWTYPDEDLIGQLIDIAEGVHPKTVAVTVMAKWVICVFDQLLPRCEE